MEKHMVDNFTTGLIKIFCLLLLSAFSLTFAQAGKLAGRVTDKKGESLPFANITIQKTSMGVATDKDGYYSIINVRPGIYSIRIGSIGYQTSIIENVRISSDQTSTLNIELNEQVIQGQEVIVTAKKPLVEFNQTSSVNSISKEDIKNLPVQNLDDIVNLQAGVIDGHFRGGRIGEVQYQVDGVTVNNPYDNSNSISIDRSLIEEVQIISGTFDAKYGQAMSGVVNAVLKTGGENFEWSGEVYGGAYIPFDNTRFPYNNNFNPTRIQNYQLTVSGPVPFIDSRFFLSGRRYDNEGYLWGQRRFIPTDKSDFENKIYNPTGDNKIVSMAYDREWSGQFKISNQVLNNIQLSYQGTLNYTERKNYSYDYRFNPDGLAPTKTVSFSHGLGFTHTLSDKLFYKINLRQNYFDYKDMVYTDLFDPRYLLANIPRSDPNYENGSVIQGVNLSRFVQQTNLYIAKGDLTWQVDRVNLVEFGLEAQTAKISFGSPGYLVQTNVNGVQILQPRYQVPTVPGVQIFPGVLNYFPFQGATYLQDRVELGDLIIRAGFRYEYFDARTMVPSDLQNPANTISGAPESHLIKTKVKSALAPRLGLSFPISASANVYFSYGHFYQYPGLNFLYNNANYSVLDQMQAGVSDYTVGVMGNPDLKPEFTIQYEFGLKQAVSDFLGVELSFFYKDIRDLLGVEFINTYTAAEYGRFTNVDFGSVYGFTLALAEKNIGPWTTNLDYTFQYAQGNSSDPRETENRAAAGQDQLPRNIPFNWDQRHTINLTLMYFKPDDISLSTILKFGSGEPYTPAVGSGFNSGLAANSGIKSAFFIADLRGEKYFNFGPVNFSVFLRIFNLFNTRFSNGFVFATTGSPDYSLIPSTDRNMLIDPSRFYQPRRLEFGITFRSN
jgi:outer membrane receptor protein involved in Fe transport